MQMMTFDSDFRFSIKFICTCIVNLTNVKNRPSILYIHMKLQSVHKMKGLNLHKASLADCLFPFLSFAVALVYEVLSITIYQSNILSL